MTTQPKPKRILIVYYSYSGNNRLLAEYLSSELGADVCPILEENERSGLTMFMDIFFRRTPKIQKLSLNIENYDHVVFLAPLWAGRIANPLKSLLQQEHNIIKEYSFVTFCGGSTRTNQLVKVKAELQQLIGKAPSEIFELAVADLFTEKEKKNVFTISKYRVKSSDLSFYMVQLQKIISSLSSKDILTSKEFQKTYEQHSHG